MEKQVISQQLAQWAIESLLYEACLSPKPGLVDAYDTGAHKDMDLYTFIDSASSLYPGFYQYAMEGLEHQGDLPSLFKKIRQIGMDIEKTNLATTKGINTHKGAIFSFGILLASCGYFLQLQQSPPNLPLKNQDIATLFSYGQLMVKDDLLKDFEGLDIKQTLTHGEQLYVDYGLMGIRGEAIHGYPVVQKQAFPLLQQLFSQTEERPSFNERSQRLLQILLTIMAFSEDTNIVTRGGIDALAYCQQAARSCLKNYQQSSELGQFCLNEMNQNFIQKNLSPGGSADLLALTIFVGKLAGYQI